MEEESVIISCGTYSPDSYLSDELFNETGTPRRTTSTVQNEDQIQSRILEALQQTNLRFDQISEQFQKLGDRLESVETRLCGIEKRQAEFFSTPSSTPELKKSKVSPRVRHEIREVYKTLHDNDEDFNGFVTNKRFTDKENQEVVTRLVSELSTLNPGITSRDIRDSARRFFQSKVEEESLKAKGKYTDKVILQRRRNRISRKLESRKSAVARSKSVSDSQKEVWSKVLNKEFISSEESGEEEVGEGETRKVIFVKPLRWRSEKVDRFFRKMDGRLDKAKSSQAKQQTLPRVVGRYSTRPRPSGYSTDFYGFTTA